jgi:hypothetical protein
MIPIVIACELIFSDIALGANPELFRGIDERCSSLGCAVVVFTLPDDALVRRSLYRVEYDGIDWQAFCSRYGSEHGALEALRRSQMARLSAIKCGRLPYREVDTSAMQWNGYAQEIAGSADWLRRS